MYLELLRQAVKKDGSLHHATLIHGHKDAVLEPLFAFIEKDLHFSVQGNPDFQLLEFDSFSISDGRSLQGRATQKALKNRKIFITTFNVMTLEAQNALLKLFEEPTEDTHFFLVTPNIDKLLRTLRSRMLVLEGEHITEADMARRATSFLSALTPKRLADIKDIIEAKDKALATSFLNALEEYLHGALHKKRSTAVVEGLQNIAHAKMYINDRGSSVKLLLEHLALTLPRV